ncbi:MAG TPA: type II secretion system protein, partial [Dongiaceae bacterium]|nr:type II secretion system protein [Dongiaceae bacterium]
SRGPEGSGDEAVPAPFLDRPCTSGLGRRHLRAFTVLELLAVIAVVVMAGLMLVPAWARTKPNVHAFQCLEDLRRLEGAITMYTHDNHDLFPPNPDDGNTVPGYAWVAGQAFGGMPPANSPAGEATDPDYIMLPQYDLIATYIASTPGVFKCPSDPRHGFYGGTDPNLKGTIIPYVRSISMNQGVGTVDPVFAADGGGHAGKPTLPVNGPWLDGYHSHRAGHPYLTFGRTTDFGFASPAGIFVLADENPWSINDAALAVIAAQPTVTDYPASYHNNGGSFSFADGHAEIHQWLSTVMALAGPARETVAPPGTPGYDDWHWFASHATKNVNTGNVP